MCKFLEKKRSEGCRERRGDRKIYTIEPCCAPKKCASGAREVSVRLKNETRFFSFRNTTDSILDLVGKNRSKFLQNSPTKYTFFFGKKKVYKERNAVCTVQIAGDFSIKKVPTDTVKRDKKKKNGACNFGGGERWGVLCVCVGG